MQNESHELNISWFWITTSRLFEVEILSNCWYSLRIFYSFAYYKPLRQEPKMVFSKEHSIFPPGTFISVLFSSFIFNESQRLTLYMLIYNCLEQHIKKYWHLITISQILFLILLKYSWFTALCYFLLYCKVIQLIYIILFHILSHYGLSHISNSRWLHFISLFASEFVVPWRSCTDLMRVNQVLLNNFSKERNSTLKASKHNSFFSLLTKETS